MVSYLTRLFGWRNFELAEDVVQDTLCQALETWKYHGLPDNPSAWLMRSARNRAIDLLRRDQKFKDFTPELTYLSRLQESETAVEQTPAFEKEIRDDQLRVMFSCCVPELSTEAQVTLILKTLCGFSVAEIAGALLTSQESIEKRLGRARKQLRQEGAWVEITDPTGISERLEAVARAVYLLFNEGYHASHSEKMVREELCYEALRLALLLSDHPLSDSPPVRALVALLCFHAARLPGRVDAEGCLILMEDQDRSKWNHALIARGFEYLARAAQGNLLSEYHLEAALSSIHCAAPSYDRTDWKRMVEIYDRLYQLNPSPIVGLNRAIARGKLEGPEAGLRELDRLPDLSKLKDYPFLPAARAELLKQADRGDEAADHFAKALKLARNPFEERFFLKKIQQGR
jgi:RNA polymerase sigma factor (sigma-70 family)